MPMAMMMLAMAGATAARADQATGEPPERITSLLLKPGETCPAPTGKEVVVCRTEDEPYRIPKPLRRSTRIAAANQSWVNRAATIDEVSRVAGGLPDTCSVIGSGGQTGCTAAALRDWAAERREIRRETATLP